MGRGQHEIQAVEGSCQGALIPRLEMGGVLLQPVLGKQKSRGGFPFSGILKPWGGCMAGETP